jgi:hypothetical protein
MAPVQNNVAENARGAANGKISAAADQAKSSSEVRRRRVFNRSLFNVEVGDPTCSRRAGVDAVH